MNEVGTRRNIWNFHPELPIENAPVFVWPPRPLAALRYLLGRGFVMSPNLLYVGFAVRNLIGVLYTQERAIRKKKLTGPAKLAHRREHSLAAVEAFFAWCKEQRQRPDLLPRNPLASALHYAVHRETGLRVFLDAPEVSIDTNHLERSLRPIPTGRRNWLFAWTELGAQRVGVIQSLLVTCRLQGVDPYAYLVDVLQRVAEHPAKRVIELTPRVWKTMFVDHPLRSDLARTRAPPTHTQ